MIDIPVEVLHQMFILLHQQDKVECMLVCRYWKRTIENLSLYHTVRLCSKSSLENFALKVKQHRFGIRVERLIIDYIDFDDGVSLNALLPLLPNLREFVRYSNLYTLSISNGSLQSWGKSIEYMTEISDPHIINHILSSSICPNLTSLSINFDFKTSISLLRNAPALKELAIDSIKITFDELELLHSLTPCLGKLRLREMNMEDFELRKVVKYATSISEFILDNVVVYNIEQESNLLQYVSAKYPKLTKFKYFNKWEYMSLPLISNTNVQPLYKNGWGPLLQGLSSQLKTLHIGCIILPEYLFDTLDNAGCELACLKAKSLSHSAFERFINSTQMSFIQILRLDDVKIRTFQFLKKLTLLKKLKLASSLCKKPMRINISRLVENCPFTVKTLSFISIRIIFGLEVSGLNSIKKLSFDNTTLPEDIDGFITRSIPQLSVLKLNCCSLQGVSFNLPKITLSHFYLGDAFPNYVRGVIVSTLRDNERRWMSLENSQSNSDKIQRYSVSDAPVFPAVKSRPAKEMNEVPFFTLECHSVNNLVIRDVW